MSWSCPSCCHGDTVNRGSVECLFEFLPQRKNQSQLAHMRQGFLSRLCAFPTFVFTGAKSHTLSEINIWEQISNPINVHTNLFSLNPNLLIIKSFQTHLTFETTWGWVNDRIEMFGWPIRLITKRYTMWWLGLEKDFLVSEIWSISGHDK